MVNRKEIGDLFEKEAFVYLKEKFDKVEWLSSKNNSSIFDFKCWKGGKVYNVDAKHRRKKVIKIPISYSQRFADYLIVKNGDVIELWDREKIEKCCKIGPKHIKSKRIKNLPPNIFPILQEGYSQKIRITKKHLKTHGLKIGDYIEMTIRKVNPEDIKVN